MLDAIGRPFRQVHLFLDTAESFEAKLDVVLTGRQMQPLEEPVVAVHDAGVVAVDVDLCGLRFDLETQRATLVAAVASIVWVSTPPPVAVRAVAIAVGPVSVGPLPV